MTENWLSPEIDNNTIGIDGYGIERKDRPTSGEGVPIYVRDYFFILIHVKCRTYLDILILK